jgi:hypothetical protein
MSYRAVMCGRSVVAAAVMALSVSIGASEPADDVRREERGDDERTGALAEGVLRQAEAAAERELDPKFRQAALASLAALPADELERRDATGSLGPLGVGPSQAQLVYTPITPCRIIDTRRAGGTLPVAAARDFRVTGVGHESQGGDWQGCGVPFGPTTAAVITFTVVNPVGPGYLRVWEYRHPFVASPFSSLLSYNSMTPSLAFSNTVVTAICDVTTAGGHGCPHDFRVEAEGSGTHLVADVAGYFERFPKELARSFSATVAHPDGFHWSVTSWCGGVLGATVALDAPTAGTVVVRGVVRSELQHAQGVADTLRFGVSRNPNDCSFPTLAGAAVASALPSDTYVSSDGVVASFPVAAGVHAFHLSAEMTSGASPFDRVTGWSLEATFHPNQLRSEDLGLRRAQGAEGGSGSR